MIVQFLGSSGPKTLSLWQDNKSQPEYMTPYIVRQGAERGKVC